MEKTMKLFLSVAALALGIAAPILAQDVVIEFKPEVFHCADYTALDDAGKAALLPLIRQAPTVLDNAALTAQTDDELTTTVTNACNEYPGELLVDALTKKN
jgi:hypothetical protein